jgi:hypothetical protein
VRVLELTGDLTAEDTASLQHSDLVLATPEKWDAVSRRDSRQLIHSIQLFMIDEVHLLSDEDRNVAPTLYKLAFIVQHILKFFLYFLAFIHSDLYQVPVTKCAGIYTFADEI